MVKNLPANAGDLGSTPGSERSSGGGNGNPLLYSCLENPMDREAWQATVYGFANSRIQLKQLSIHCALVVHILGFPGSSVVKNLPANAGDVGSIPGLGRSPGEGIGNPLQYSCLGNPTERSWLFAVHGVAKIWT